MPLIPEDYELVSRDLTTAEFQRGLKKFVNGCKQMQGGAKPKKYILEKVGGEFTFTPASYSCILELPAGENKADISLINPSLISHGFIALKLANPALAITIKHKNTLLNGGIITYSGKDINLKSNSYTLFEFVDGVWVEQRFNLSLGTPSDAGKYLVMNENGEVELSPPPKVDKYDLCEFYYFRHPKLRDGFMPAYGGLIEKASKTCPEAFEYLQTEHGKFLCKTEEEWQALTKETWATLADGTKVGWDGIGGAPYYVVDTKMDTLRLPDLRGMYVEAAGFDDLSVGGAHGDAIRNIWGSGFNTMNANNPNLSPYPTGAMRWKLPKEWLGLLNGQTNSSYRYLFDSSYVVPTSNKNQPRAWGALPCVYLGN